MLLMNQIIIAIITEVIRLFLQLPNGANGVRGMTAIQLKQLFSDRV